MRPTNKAKETPRRGEVATPSQPRTPAPRPLFTQVLHGSSLCELVVWTDDDWAALAPAERPELASHFPGLGWVCCVPVLNMN